MATSSQLNREWITCPQCGRRLAEKVGAYYVQIQDARRTLSVLVLQIECNRFLGEGRTCPGVWRPTSLVLPDPWPAILQIGAPDGRDDQRAERDAPPMGPPTQRTASLV